MTMTPEELEKLNQKRSKIVDDLYDFFNSSKENQQRVQESENKVLRKGKLQMFFIELELRKTLVNNV